MANKQSSREGSGAHEPVKVDFVFRRRDPEFFSIEKVFDQIIGHLPEGFQPIKRELPRFSDGLFSLIANILHCLRFQGEVFHITGDIHYVALALPRRKVVLTIHDCVFLHRYRGVKAWIIRKLYLEWPVRKASVITAISDSTKREIVDVTRCNPDRIMVIPDPITVHAPVAPRQFDSENPRILFIGFHPHKNLDRVIESLKGIRCRLVLLGRYEERTLRSIEDAGIEFETHYRLSEERLLALYQGCDILLFPSLYEGFGMPILEAQAAGRVVVTSNVSPMKDVSDGGACLVDPYSVDSIRSGLLRVIGDPSYRDTLVRRGYTVASKYLPQRIAVAYAAAYEKCLGRRTDG